MAVEKAIPKISDGPAKDERQAEAGSGHTMAVLPQEGRNHYQREKRKQDQDSHPPLGNGIGKEPEGGAPILHVDKAKETGNDSDAVVQRNVFCHYPFRQLVENDHQQGDQEVVLAHCVMMGH